MPSIYTAVARLLPALFTVSPGLFLLSPESLAEPKRWIGLSGALGGVHGDCPRGPPNRTVA